MARQLGLCHPPWSPKRSSRLPASALSQPGLLRQLGSELEGGNPLARSLALLLSLK